MTVSPSVNATLSELGLLVGSYDATKRLHHGLLQRRRILLGVAVGELVEDEQEEQFTVGGAAHVVEEVVSQICLQAATDLENPLTSPLCMNIAPLVERMAVVLVDARSGRGADVAEAENWRCSSTARGGFCRGRGPPRWCTRVGRVRVQAVPRQPDCSSRTYHPMPQPWTFTGDYGGDRSRNRAYSRHPVSRGSGRSVSRTWEGPRESERAT